MLLGVDIPLVGTPSIGIEARDTKRLQQGLQLQKDPILALSKDISQHLPTVMINRVPQPPLVRFLADITPHLIELCPQPAPRFKLFSSTLSKEVLKAIFEEASMKASFNDEGDLHVSEALHCLVLPSDSRDRIRLLAMFAFEPQVSQQQRLEFVNQVNSEFILIRASVGAQNDTLF